MMGNPEEKNNKKKEGEGDNNKNNNITNIMNMIALLCQ